MAPSIVSTFSAYTQSPPVALYAFAPSADPLSLQSSSSWTKRFSAFPLVVPSAFVALAVNVLTQAICIRGVNRLTAVSRPREAKLRIMLILSESLRLRSTLS